MKLILSGTSPIYLVVLLIIVVVIAVIWIYRRQPISGYARIVLPMLRVAALLLLSLCLLQPVLSRIEKKEQQGVVAIIIDDSESMGISDPYLEWQKLKLAVELGLITMDSTEAQFEKRAEAWGEIIELSYKTPSWLAAMDDANQTQNLEMRAKPILELMSLIEKQLDSETRSLEPKQWESMQVKKSKDEQPEFEKKRELLVQEQKKIALLWTECHQLMKEMLKENDAKKQLKTLTNQLKLMMVVIQNQAKIWIETQISVAVTRTKDLDSSTKGFEDIMKSQDRLELVKSCIKAKKVRDLLSLKGNVRFFDLDISGSYISESSVQDLKSTLKRTTLGSKLRDVLKQYDDQLLAAVLIFSDGNNNAGQDLESAKQMARDRSIPVYGIGVGGVYAPPDIAVLKAIAPKSSFVGDVVRVQTWLSREGFTNQKITIKLTSNNEILDSKTLEPTSVSQQLVEFDFKELRPGRQSYRIEVEQLEGEVMLSNNEKDIDVNILGDRIKTLLIEEFPRWESRYAVMMLNRDPRIDLTAIFIASTPNGRLPQGPTGFPNDLDGLHAYHILVLGDVNPRHFNREQLESIKNFVFEGGTLMVIAGSQHMPQSYLQTPLVEVLPLIINANSEIDGIESVKPKLTSGGFYEDVVFIGADIDETKALWENLPALNWENRKVRASAVANDLVKSEAGYSILNRADIGAGKVLYLGSDSFWRWRNLARWTYHHKFWSQILLWATSSRTTGKDDHVKLMSQKGIYDSEESVEMRAKILSEDGLPLRNAAAVLEVRDAKGELVRKALLLYVANSAGDYTAKLAPFKEGTYQVKPVVNELPIDLDAAIVGFEVKELPTNERLALGLNMTKMQRLCEEVDSIDNVVELIQKIEPVNKITNQRYDREIWDSFPMMVIISLLLGLEWHIRKKIGLV